MAIASCASWDLIDLRCRSTAKIAVTTGECISLWLREVGGAYWDDCIAKEHQVSRRQGVRLAREIVDWLR